MSNSETSHPGGSLSSLHAAAREPHLQPLMDPGGRRPESFSSASDVCSEEADGENVYKQPAAGQYLSVRKDYIPTDARNGENGASRPDVTRQRQLFASCRDLEMPETIEMEPVDPDSSANPASDTSIMSTQLPDNSGTTLTNVEQGRQRNPRDTHTCYYHVARMKKWPRPFPWLAGILESCSSSWSKKSRRTRLIILISIIICLCLMIFTLLLTPSFIYVHYYEIALLKNRFTGYVDKKQTFYAGCYLEGFHHEYVRFTKSAIKLQLDDLQVMSKDKLAFKFDCTLHYFIKPQELGTLFDKFDQHYHSVLEKTAISTLKNTAVQLSLQDFLERRANVEETLHEAVTRKLGGNCCFSCCPKCLDEDLSNCSRCSSVSNCSRGYHVDVRHFHLGAVEVPDSIADRFLRISLLGLAHEEEISKQESAVLHKETEEAVQGIKNQANEIAGQSEAHSKLLISNGQAEADAITQNATIHALHQMYSKLKISLEDRKMSLYMLHVMDHMDNLYSGYEYETLSRWTNSVQ